jgi:hypothetical protein
MCLLFVSVPVAHRLVSRHDVMKWNFTDRQLTTQLEEEAKSITSGTC